MKKHKKYKEEDDDYTLAKKAEEKAGQDELDKIILEATSASETKPEVKPIVEKENQILWKVVLKFCVVIILCAALFLAVIFFLR